MSTTCPNLLPSLDHPSGFYCRAECGGNCHNAVSRGALSDNNAIPRVSSDDQPRTAPSCGGQRPEQLAHAAEPSFEPGAVVWKEMEYYQQRVWVAFTINDDDTATGEALVNGSTIVDTLVVNRCFKRGARSHPPENVHLENLSDSANPRRSSDLERQDFTLENVSDSLKPRESHCENSGRFWHEAGEYTSKGRLYYRYRWGRGHRIEGVRHIPGGSLRRELVKERAALVERAVYVDFRPHHEIVALIDGWRSRSLKQQQR